VLAPLLLLLLLAARAALCWCMCLFCEAHQGFCGVAAENLHLALQILKLRFALCPVSLLGLRQQAGRQSGGRRGRQGGGSVSEQARTRFQESHQQWVCGGQILGATQQQT
jgi:hypothetical protein